MSSFEVRCVVGEDHFCIEVPNDCSVGDVLKKAPEHSSVEGISFRRESGRRFAFVFRFSVEL
jgi:hypothetical protein